MYIYIYIYINIYIYIHIHIHAYQKNHLEVPTGTLLLLVGFDKDDDIMINFVLDLEGDSFKVCIDTMLGEDLKLCSKVIPIR